MSQSTFLPEDYITAKSEGRANVIALSLYAVVLAGVIGACIVTTRSLLEVRGRNRTASELLGVEGKKIEQIKSLESQRAQMMEKAEITAALIEKVPRWALLGETTLRMPLDMRLEQLCLKSTRAVAPPPPAESKPTTGAPLVKSLTDKVTGSKKEPPKPKVTAPVFTYALTIDGSAMRNNDVADYIASLKQSPVLDKVEMTFIKVVNEKDKEVRKFEVTANVRTNVDSTVLSDSLRRLISARSQAIAGRDAEKKTKATGATASAGEKGGE